MPVAQTHLTCQRNCGNEDKLSLEEWEWGGGEEEIGEGGKVGGGNGSPKYFGIPLTQACPSALLHYGTNRFDRQELVRQSALLPQHMQKPGGGGGSVTERSGGLFSKLALKFLF